MATMLSWPESSATSGVEADTTIPFTKLMGIPSG